MFFQVLKIDIRFSVCQKLAPNFFFSFPERREKKKKPFVIIEMDFLADPAQVGRLVTSDTQGWT